MVVNVKEILQGAAKRFANHIKQCDLCREQVPCEDAKRLLDTFQFLATPPPATVFIETVAEIVERVMLKHAKTEGVQ